jgi:hypothetical protein
VRTQPDSVCGEMRHIPRTTMSFALACPAFPISNSPPGRPYRTEIEKGKQPSPIIRAGAGGRPCGKDQDVAVGRCHSFSNNSTRMAKKISAKGTSLYGIWSIQSKIRQQPSK